MNDERTQPDRILKAVNGDRRALARLLSWIESADPRSAHLMTQTAASTSRVLGVTGPPGAGKSTLISRLVTVFRDEGEAVAILAIDPTSPITGGALLGDRIRMAAHMHDPHVFIRSFATRGELGGLATVVPEALHALSVVGFDRVIVETVGVGQVEVAIGALADTTMVVTNPGWGDGVQASKAGLIEIADLFVVNKADRPGLESTVAQLREVLALRLGGSWTPPVERCVAETGDGVADVRAAIARHEAFLSTSDGLDERRQTRLREVVRSCLISESLRRSNSLMRDQAASAVLEAVYAGSLAPRSAAEQLLAAASGPTTAP